MSPGVAMAFLLAVGAAAQLEGQWPDGSPPPCGRAAQRATRVQAVLQRFGLSRP